MGSLKGDKAAQRKRRLQDKHKQAICDRTGPRMEPNVRVKSYKLEELLDDPDDS